MFACSTFIHLLCQRERDYPYEHQFQIKQNNEKNHPTNHPRRRRHYNDVAKMFRFQVANLTMKPEKLCNLLNKRLKK